MTEQVVKIKEICGIEKASCETCDYGFAENDGNYGEIYCGCFCWKIKKTTDHCYVEDAGLDIHTEKDCWEPNFWHSKFTDIIDGTENSMEEAVRQFREAVEGVDKCITSKNCPNGRRNI